MVAYSFTKTQPELGGRCVNLHTSLHELVSHVNCSSQASNTQPLLRTAPASMLAASNRAYHQDKHAFRKLLLIVLPLKRLRKRNLLHHMQA
jgi:hypothetical protein